MIIAILQAEILRCIFLLFFSSRFYFLSIISFGEKMQRKTKAAHNEHYIDIICVILKIKKQRIKKKKKKRKHLFENVITIGFYNLLFAQVFLTHACILSRHLFFYFIHLFILLFCRPCGVPKKINQVISTGDIRTYVRTKR